MDIFIPDVPPALTTAKYSTRWLVAISYAWPSHPTLNLLAGSVAAARSSTSKKARTRLRKVTGRAAYRVMEKQLNAYAVVATDGAVVTVGHRDKRITRP